MANRTLTLSDTPSSRLYCSLQYPPDAQTSMHIHAWQSYAAQKVGGSRTLLARCSPIEVQISVAFEAVLRVNRGDGSRRQQKQQTEESSHLAATPVMTSLHILLWRCRNYTFQDNHYNLSTKPAQQSHRHSNHFFAVIVALLEPRLTFLRPVENTQPATSQTQAILCKRYCRSTRRPANRIPATPVSQRQLTLLF